MAQFTVELDGLGRVHVRFTRPDDDQIFDNAEDFVRWVSWYVGLEQPPSTMGEGGEEDSRETGDAPSDFSPSPYLRSRPTEIGFEDLSTGEMMVWAAAFGTKSAEGAAFGLCAAVAWDAVHFLRIYAPHESGALGEMCRRMAKRGH